MGVSSPRALWAGCSERFLLGWLPLLLAPLAGSSGTTSSLPPDGRHTAVRTQWWHTTPVSCPSTLFDPCPQSLWMPWRKHGIRLSVLAEQDDEVHFPLTYGVKPVEQTCGRRCWHMGSHYHMWTASFKPCHAPEPIILLGVQSYV